LAPFHVHGLQSSAWRPTAARSGEALIAVFVDSARGPRQFSVGEPGHGRRDTTAEEMSVP